MKLPNEKFCVLPWISLETSPIGTVRPCCLAEEEITNDQGDKFDLNTAKFGDIQNSHYMQNLRQQFLDGQQPQTCRKCWREERSGRTSKRMHTLDRLKHMIGSEKEWTVDAKPLLFLDLKLGNICNLKCRICGSWSSSTFATEELNWLGPNEDKKSTYHYKMLRAGAWPKENPSFWQEIEQVVDQIKYIEFTGGEPFMIQEHFDFLQRLVDQGCAGNIEIHYNTNGTQWPDKAEQIWKNFKLVEIAFSIDDVGERFEYQRSGANWIQVQDNLQKFFDLRSRNHNIHLQLCITVNVFNVYYLDKIVEWSSSKLFNFVYWNMMHEAYYFSIATLPQSAKDAIKNKLQSTKLPIKIQDQFNNIISFMDHGTSLDGQILRMRIADLDRKRNQNLSIVEPEFAQLIDYAGPN